MHGSVYGFLEAHASAADVAGKRVLEVGALDVNGSPRRVLEPLGPAEYIGVDIRPGPKVDRVCQAAEIVDLYGPERFDVVVSTEMLEHASDWWGAVSNMKRALVPGGLLLLTTRSPGFPQHDHPGDYWRFTRQDALEIFSDMEELVVLDDPAAPGVFVRAKKPAAFFEADLTKKSVPEAPRA
jgi:SAM-dependent methyltransferase